MIRKFIIFTLVALLSALSLKEDISNVPRTNISNSSIACHIDSAPKITNGFATHFSGDSMPVKIGATKPDLCLIVLSLLKEFAR